MVSTYFNPFSKNYESIWNIILNKVNNLTKQLGFETTNQSASDGPLGYTDTQSCIIWGHYSWIISWQTVCPIYTVLLIKKILGSGELQGVWVSTILNSNQTCIKYKQFWKIGKHADFIGKLRANKHQTIDCIDIRAARAETPNSQGFISCPPVSGPGHAVKQHYSCSCATGPLHHEKSRQPHGAFWQLRLLSRNPVESLTNLGKHIDVTQQWNIPNISQHHHKWVVRLPSQNGRFSIGFATVVNCNVNMLKHLRGCPLTSVDIRWL